MSTPRPRACSPRPRAIHTYCVVCVAAGEAPATPSTSSHGPTLSHKSCGSCRAGVADQGAGAGAPRRGAAGFI